MNINQKARQKQREMNQKQIIATPCKHQEIKEASLLTISPTCGEQNNIDREEMILANYACKSIDAIRKTEEPNDTIRSSFFRDIDKIIHSKAYTRYIDKTQVFALFDNDHITHRVLHVQFVSKIGRTIGRALKLNEDLIEAIALGHDLGHSPYGHDGERILNDICVQHNIGSFQHNGQSIKCVTELARNGKGLNLSLQVLDGILTHNGEICSKEYTPDYNKNWEQFKLEYKNTMNNSKNANMIKPMTLEGCVVRVSDIIAYIGKDIEDAIILNLIKREEIPKTPLGITNKDIVNILVNDIITNSYNKDHLSFSDPIYNALFELKKFNYEKIYQSTKIKVQYNKIVNIFHSLFDKYLVDLTNNNQDSEILSIFLKNMPKKYKNKTNQKRKVIDFLAGMTDNYLINQFKETYLPKSFGYKV